MDVCKLNIQGMSCPALKCHRSVPNMVGNRVQFFMSRPHSSTTTTSRRLRALVDDNMVTTVLLEPAQVQVTWQIVFGALAGVTPFVVAGIEFNKRIVAQRQCKVCNGSGLVLRDKKYYFRCPNCGGFLPWQSWKRFFTG